MFFMPTRILINYVGDEEESFLGSFLEVAMLVTTISVEQKMFITLPQLRSLGFLTIYISFLS